MQDLKIFTEGKGDVKFIADYVQEIFGINLDHGYFDTLGSWSGYKAGGDIEDSIQQSHDNSKQIILILDADNDIAKRQKEVKQDFISYNIPMHLFLFPDQNMNGNIEKILTEIAVDRKLMNCFLSYEDCVKDYNLPLEKSRIYSYLDSILPEDCKTKKNDLRKEENRDYKNYKHWNLQHEYLQPFHDFLAPFFK